jgi:hypothetical protein
MNITDRAMFVQMVYLMDEASGQDNIKMTIEGDWFTILKRERRERKI